MYCSSEILICVLPSSYFGYSFAEPSAMLGDFVYTLLMLAGNGTTITATRRKRCGTKWFGFPQGRNCTCVVMF